MSKFKLFSKISIIIVLAIIIAGIIFLNFSKLDLPIKNFAIWLFSPAQKIFYKSGNRTVSYLSAIFSANNLLQENQSLKKQNLELKAQILQLAEFSKENEILKKQLNSKLPEKDENNYIFANVVNCGSDNFGQYLLIDKGSREGITEESAVIISGNILVGKIVEVFSSSAKVLLINDLNSSVKALTQKNRVSGAVKGEPGGKIFLEMIPQKENVEIGEQIITAGLGRSFPKGLLIGEISEVLANDVEAFKKARIKPAANLVNIETVFVIAP